MTITFEEYQRRAHETAVYPGADPANTSAPALCYLGLKLAGESGEVAEKLGKLYRDHQGKFPPAFRAELAKELGDVLWYVSELAYVLGVSLEDVASGNVKKLADRQARNALKGDGDNR